MDARTRARSSGGFSLLEVLIAIMLVGIIAAAVVPMIGDYAERAMLARNYANVQEIGKAMARYDLEHRAPLGYVYDSSQSPPAYLQYKPEDAVGFWRQLMNPTDANGNVLGDPVTAESGPFQYGPFLRGEENAASLLLSAGGTPTQRRSGVVDADIVFNPDGSADLTMTFTPSKALGGQDPLTTTIHMVSSDPSMPEKVANEFAQLGETATVRFWTALRSHAASVVIRVGSSDVIGGRPAAPVYCTAPVLSPLAPGSILLAQGRASNGPAGTPACTTGLALAAFILTDPVAVRAPWAADPDEGAGGDVVLAVSSALGNACNERSLGGTVGDTVSIAAFEWARTNVSHHPGKGPGQ